MPNQLLPAMPEISIGSIDEILSLALALEQQAAARYALFGRCMRQVGHRDLAELFEGLATEEQHHIEHVEDLSEKLLSHPPSADILKWIIPETFGVEELASPSDLTAYEILAIAVRSEERAFSFWSYVAAAAQNDAVRSEAEAMARQELVHASRLRHERRRAYRPDGHTQQQTARNRNEVTDAADARCEASQLEETASDFLSAAALRLEWLGDRESAQLLTGIAEDMRSNALNAAPISSANQEDLIGRSIDAAAKFGRIALLFEAAGVLDRLVGRYTGMLVSTRGGDGVEAIEKLVAPAIANLSAINDRLYQVAPELQSMAIASDKAELSGKAFRRV